MLATNLKKLREYVEKAINNSLEKEVMQEIRETELRHVKKDVYSKYEPEVYMRRYEDDGLYDPENIEYNNEKVKKGVLEIENTTIFNPYHRKDYGYQLPALIEYGWVETFRRAYPGEEIPAYVKPRPFISNTKKEIKETKSHVKALKRGLSRSGIKTEKVFF